MISEGTPETILDAKEVNNSKLQSSSEKLPKNMEDNILDPFTETISELEMLANAGKYIRYVLIVLYVCIIINSFNCSASFLYCGGLALSTI